MSVAHAASMTELMERTCIIVPCLNEERSIAEVVAAANAAVPGATVVVVDDGSTDQSAAHALEAGAVVLRLPYNLGIGGAVQTGFRFAVANDFDVAVQVDGDGQHDPAETVRLLEVLLADEADIAIGTRWLGRGQFDSTKSRRLGMKILARVVSAKAHQRFTDTTSGFRAVGRHGLELFANSYPTDFAEVESIIHARAAGLRLVEVPVEMSERVHGRSSLAGLRSAYYMARVLMALLLDGLSVERS